MTGIDDVKIKCVSHNVMENGFLIDSSLILYGTHFYFLQNRRRTLPSFSLLVLKIMSAM